mmetsp:Transcript_4796/g.13350  ORF Transcript_4796/g.13350 Transcript_4796/m.13350 type:complete len:102 (+) Transcript_4796:1539-1844(+)
MPAGPCVGRRLEALPDWAGDIGDAAQLLAGYRPARGVAELGGLRRPHGFSLARRGEARRLLAVHAGVHNYGLEEQSSQEDTAESSPRGGRTVWGSGMYVAL